MSENHNCPSRSDPLVQDRLHYVGITLNYSPKMVFRVGKSKHLWGSLTPDQQKAIFDEHIDKIYKHHFRVVEYTFELTKEGNLHCHAMGTIEINPDHSEIILWDIRKKVGQHPEVIRYTKGRPEVIKRSNYIHYVERAKWTEYMTKDSNKIPYKKNTILSYL